jgi:DNA processing protein
VSDRQLQLAQLLACCEAARRAKLPWWQVARAVRRTGSVEHLLREPWEPVDRWEEDLASALALHLRPGDDAVWAEALTRWRSQDPGLRLVTILDPDFPVNLVHVFNPPPFVVVRGDLRADDSRGVAVVGTRQATRQGLRRAHHLSQELASAGITVFSGLARGIDTAAHSGALEAGGRTVAVLGHGLLRPVYPRENKELAGAIGEAGALISQFRPDQAPTRGTFPLRNAVMSGLAQATAVVEAGETSGARMQARLAVEQGRRVWLTVELVGRFPWARDFSVRYPQYVRVIDTIDEVVDEVIGATEIPQDPLAPLPPVHEAEMRRRPSSPSRPLFA